LTDGAFAEYLMVPERALIRLPDSIPFEIGAILTDAVSTAYHAVTCRGDIRHGETVAVIGCGGVGHHAIIWAKQRGAAKVFAVDTSEAALQRAQQAGADNTINAKEDNVPRTIRTLTGGVGVDCALEFVGRAETVTNAIKCLRRGGRAVVVGVGQDRVTLPTLQTFVGNELSLVGSLGFHRGDLEEIIKMVASQKVDLSASVGEVVPLDDINEALHRLAEQKSDTVRMVVGF